MRNGILVKTALVLLVASLSWGALAAETCGGCEALRSAAESVRRSDENKVSTVAAAVEAATKAIAKLPHDAKNKLNLAQVKELVALLRETEKKSMGTVAEDSAALLKSNEAMILDEVKKLPADEAAAIKDTVKSAIRGAQDGQDAPETAAAPTPRTRPSHK